MTIKQHPYDQNPAPAEWADDDELWEQATVNGFDAFFPPAMSQVERIARNHAQELKEQIDTAHRILDTYDIGPGTLCERIGLLAADMLHHQQRHEVYKSIARNGGEIK